MFQLMSKKNFIKDIFYPLVDYGSVVWWTTSSSNLQELIVKYNIGLKTLLHQGMSEPIFMMI